MTRVAPGSSAPNFEVSLQDGSIWSLANQQPTHFTMIVIFRHSNCSICNGYLKKLDDRVGQFSKAGVNILAASVGSALATAQMAEKFTIENLTFACDVPLDMARQWGLFVSAKRKDMEPEQFFEPALFLIDATGMLYYASIQSMPFGRPDPLEILQWIPKLIENAIPARGEVKN